MHLSAKLALIFATLCWAGNYIVGRLLGDDLPPVMFNTLRWSIAFCVLLPFASLRQAGLFELVRRRLGWFLIMSATGIAAFHTLIYFAVHFTTATNMSMISAATPVTILIFSSLLYGERHSLFRICGVILCLAGVVFLVWGNLSEVNIGDIFACLTVPLWAYYSVSLRQSPKEIDGITLNFIFALFGLIMMLPFALVEISIGQIMTFSTQAFFGLLFVGIFSAGIAQVLWTKGVVDIGAANAGVFMNLLPIFGILGGIIILGESFTYKHSVSAALIIIGIFISQFRPNLRSKSIAATEKHKGKQIEQL